MPEPARTTIGAMTETIERADPTLTESLSKGERLIPLDVEPPRGWQVLGELELDGGPRLHIIHWRRQKRLDHQVLRDTNAGLLSARRVYELFTGRHE